VVVINHDRRGLGGLSLSETAQMTILASQLSKVSITIEALEAFEALIPSIERTAAYAFRRFPRWRRLELIADVVATAYTTFVRLANRGLKSLAYPSTLAKFAIRQVRAGREVGSNQTVRDALSPLAQRHKRFSVLTLGERTGEAGWERLAEGRNANPAEVASCRVDFASWLSRLTKFKRDVALRLAVGDTTSEAAAYFGVSRARISQLRQELLANWNAFQAVPAT
jgi:hypothetical protein